MAEEHFIQDFLATLSHEFRTPLASLIASLELFGEDGAQLSRQEQAELLRMLRLSATNLQTLVDNLLDNANLQAERLKLNLQPSPLQKIIVEAIHLMQALLDRRGQALHYHSPLALSPVLADGPRIRQVLVNLLMNASKYSSEGSSIDITVQVQGEAVQVFIADRGSGLPSTDPQLLFLPFQRFPPSPNVNQFHQEEVSGLGLGLAVVKGLIEAHGGQIYVQAREGGGAIFGFSLQKA